MKKITIVGGGTAGYVSALILKTRFRMYDVSVIKSDKIGIVGVGEGSTEHWSDFMNFVGLDFRDLIRETDATYKGGIMFDGWGENIFAHNLGSMHFDSQFQAGQENTAFVQQILEPKHQFSMNMPEFYYNKIASEDSSKQVFQQFHFNTFKLNEYLDRVCRELNINVIVDEIKEVKVNENGIDSLISETQTYKADFYIDSTGFRRLLIDNLGAKWQSNGKYLKMKEAIAFPTEDTDDYPVGTLAKGMKNGWMWRIPTYGRWGNGYIFDSDYINADQAKQEVEQFLGNEIEIGKHIKFDSGKLDNVWIKNCLAVGLSANFVEPLEATSIGTSIQQMFLFMNYFDNYTDYDIIDYNNKVNIIMDNIRDFICLHYITKRNDTEFWRSLKDIDLPDTLSEKLEKWKYRLPINEDFQGTEYMLFWSSNFIQIMNGLDLIDKKMIAKKHDMFFQSTKDVVREAAERHIEEHEMRLNNYLTHKQYLTNIRETNYD